MGEKMGLTKDYLRYVPAGNFNIISSPNCNAVFITLQGQIGRFIAVGASEHIIIWDLRLGEKAQVLPGEKAVVTSICPSPNEQRLAAGYSDGTVQIYDLKSAEVISIFSGHRSEVTSLAYDSNGMTLASGSKDTDIIIWDTVDERGLCRLSGHKGPITKVCFMSKIENVLISSSKDSFIKFWDLKAEHCFKTLTEHQTEVWGLSLIKNDQFLVAGGADAKLWVYKLSIRDGENQRPEELLSNLELPNWDEGDDSIHPLQCLKAGSLLRAGQGRVISLASDSTGQVLGCHGSDRQIELFYFCPDDEVKIRMKKRLKKEQKKAGTDQGTSNRQLSLRDIVKRLSSIKLEAKPKSLDLVLGQGRELRVAVNFGDNSVSLYNLKTSVKDSEATFLRGILRLGHHSDVRALAFSSDNLAIVSGSSESVKMWNRTSLNCIITVETGFVLALAFVPGDRNVLAGLKDGRLLVIDIGAGDVLEEISAHRKDLTCICLTPDQGGCVSGGYDQTVKFWQFELVKDSRNDSKAKILSLIHKKTLKLEQNVRCLKLSPNGKFVAVALEDHTVKMFFVDSLKLYLSLHGHKLPVLCLDISSDSTLIATGSGDRDIKIWGMDFGDCRRTIFAHDDAVMDIKFVPKTHYLFTCGRDGKVKEWDADSYTKIITLPGHPGEAHCLSVSPSGQYVVSSGSDRVLRLYERSDQIVVPQDEEENEREREEELATGEEIVVPSQPGLNLASRRTVGSERAVESILECLEVCEKYQTEPHPSSLPLLMQALKVDTPEDFLLETFRRIRASDLEHALLLLPFKSVCEILTVLPDLAARGDCTELCNKIGVFLVKIHHKTIVANGALLPTLEKLDKVLKEKMNELRDLVGYNYHAMLYLQQQIEAKEGVQMFRDLTIEKSKRNRDRKKREKLKRSIVVLNS